MPTASPRPAALLPLPGALKPGFALVLALWTCAGLLLGAAELQHYLAAGGRHPWEPFLWELSSTTTLALLSYRVYRWHQRLAAQPHGWAMVAGHLFGAMVFTLLHTVIILAVRLAIYAAAGETYRHGPLPTFFLYEALKDGIVYAVLVAFCHGIRLQLRERERREQALRLERLEQELANARANRLLEQIQPHFLFNTLNLVSSVMYEDLDRADQILSDLADLLRQTLQAHERPLQPLSAELQLLRPYLAIMQARFGERLAVEFDISPAAADCQVPVLLLISPIENAIKHGVAKSCGPATVTVAARVDGGRLEVVVRENVGQLETDTPGRRDGLGLRNIRERLQAMYADAASVTLQPLPAGGAELRLRLPAQRRP